MPPYLIYTTNLSPFSPDFRTGGLLDATRYNDGARGGSVKVRAKIDKIDSKTLAITELPFRKNHFIANRVHNSGTGEGEDKDSQGGRQHCGDGYDYGASDARHFERQDD